MKITRSGYKKIREELGGKITLKLLFLMRYPYRCCVLTCAAKIITRRSANSRILPCRVKMTAELYFSALLSHQGGKRFELYGKAERGVGCGVVLYGDGFAFFPENYFTGGVCNGVARENEV